MISYIKVLFALVILPIPLVVGFVWLIGDFVRGVQIGFKRNAEEGGANWLSDPNWNFTEIGIDSIE